MIKRSNFALLVFFTLSALASIAQTNQANGWLFLLHKQKLAKKINLLSDVQVRSAAEFDYVATLLLRSALSYQFNKKHALALGYAYISDWKQTDQKKTYEDENRIFEQYLVELKAHKTELTGRFRLEQRFTGTNNRDFTQRTRFLISALFPLIKGSSFSAGPYFIAQNEILLTVQNKEKLNNHVFDQNRLYGGFGYKFSSHLRTELGYMYRRKQNSDDYINHHIIQLTIATSL